MPSPARIIPEPPPAFPPAPAALREFLAKSPAGRPGPLGKDPLEAMFFAGLALAALHPIARSEHPLGSLWRQRLALQAATKLVRQQGRTEDEGELRDAWYLSRPSGDPGPAGRILGGWRRLSEPSAMPPKTWIWSLSLDLGLPQNATLTALLDSAATLTKDEGSPITAAVLAATLAIRIVPEYELAAPWLADMVLAHGFNWPAAVPLLAGQVRRAELFAAAKKEAPDLDWQAACALGFARAALSAIDLYSELARRARKLTEAAPTLRSRDADFKVALLLLEDAQPASAGKSASDRSARRLFERLEALGAVRELTGRSTFRLYGL